MNCPVCKKEMEIVISGNGMYYYCCPNKRNEKHIFEIGPYQSMDNLKKIIKTIEGK